MKLELKHLAPYLPYGLQINQHREDININWQSELVSLSADQLKVMSRKFPYIENLAYYEAKPILHPLSDLTKEQQETLRSMIQGSDLIKHHSINILTREDLELDYIINKTRYCIINKLFEWHFDVFGLIKEGLAIDINTLES